eukprot:TRINITY_DN1179_c0_g1_i1.p1 TRINITY_DN1179_c0_g1~~TRINITY_DN1179_c0_g1_i1.p1  ORF type:complete len:144 (-),score=36.25 TRINITY_DN1179_c0_g1_i1:816-1247(-)
MATSPSATEVDSAEAAPSSSLKRKLEEEKVSPNGVYVFGNNQFGQLGLEGASEENSTNILIPTKLSRFDHVLIKKISCGSHSVVLSTEGVVYTMGSNEQGQLGHSKRQRVPQRVDVLETMNIINSGCGDNFTLVINDNGQLAR